MRTPPPRCCRTWFWLRVLGGVILGVAWLVYIAGAPAACGCLMLVAFAVLVVAEQVDRAAAVVAWARRKRPRSQ